MADWLSAVRCAGAATSAPRPSMPTRAAGSWRRGPIPTTRAAASTAPPMSRGSRRARRAGARRRRSPRTPSPGASRCWPPASPRWSRGRLYYRGRDAVVLAETETLEAVARLLRGGDGVPPMETAAGTAAGARRCARQAVRRVRPRGRRRTRQSVGAARMYWRRRASLLYDAAADAVAGRVGEGPIHARLAEAWGVVRTAPT